MAWTPRRKDPEAHQTLVDGVPTYMHSPLRGWFINEFMRTDASFQRVYDIGRMHRHDLDNRATPYVDDLRHNGPGPLFDYLSADEKLDIIDWIVHDNAQSGHQENNGALEIILTMGGSMWKVGMRDGEAGLEQRVPEGVQTAAEATMATTATAGSLLSEAWRAAFGVNPDREEAYEKAIKSVEEAGADKVSPKNSKTTLGTMIRDMKAQGDWKLPLGSPEADSPVRMAEALWQGQESRHGGNGYRKPTQEEAEAAVLLAVPLVQWFSSGVLARRP